MFLKTTVWVLTWELRIQVKEEQDMPFSNSYTFDHLGLNLATRAVLLGESEATCEKVCPVCFPDICKQALLSLPGGKGWEGLPPTETGCPACLDGYVLEGICDPQSALKARHSSVTNTPLPYSSCHWKERKSFACPNLAVSLHLAISTGLGKYFLSQQRKRGITKQMWIPL